MDLWKVQYFRLRASLISVVMQSQPHRAAYDNSFGKSFYSILALVPSVERDTFPIEKGCVQKTAL